jgi:hypothetical protein
MMDNQNPIARATDINLDPIGPGVQRRLKGGYRVLVYSRPSSPVSGAPMGYNQRATIRKVECGFKISHGDIIYVDTAPVKLMAITG